MVMLSGCGFLGGDDPGTPTPRGDPPSASEIQSATVSNLSSTDSLSYTLDMTVEYQNNQSQINATNGSGKVLVNESGDVWESYNMSGMQSYTASTDAEGYLTGGVAYTKVYESRPVFDINPDAESDEPEWNKGEVEALNRSETQLGTHQTLLSQLSSDSVENISWGSGQNVVVQYTVPAANITEFYGSIPANEPGHVSFPEGPENYTVQYTINTSTYNIQELSFTMDRTVLYAATEKSATVTTTLTFSGHGSTSISIPQAAKNSVITTPPPPTASGGSEKGASGPTPATPTRSR